jgi:CubicO group peptidase (beta-lactamase class C family)
MSEGWIPGRVQRLLDVFAVDVERGAIPGVVVSISRDGASACYEAFGFRDREAGVPMTRDAIFRGASITKPLTVTAALTCVEDGTLRLADPVSRYLPALRDLQVGVERVRDGERELALEPSTREITIQDLMRHTAGFTYGGFGDSLVQRAYRAAGVMDLQQTNAELIEKLARLPLAYQPGSTFEYGMSIDVLGAVVEVVAGAPLDRVVAERITGPLGMPDTGFVLREPERLAYPQVDAATGARPDLNGLYDPARPPRWFSGGGGILTTAADYARFAQMLLNGGTLDGARVLGRKTVALMTTSRRVSASGRSRPSSASPRPFRGSGKASASASPCVSPRGAIRTRVPSGTFPGPAFRERTSGWTPKSDWSPC